MTSLEWTEAGVVDQIQAWILPTTVPLWLYITERLIVSLTVLSAMVKMKVP